MKGSAAHNNALLLSKVKMAISYRRLKGGAGENSALLLLKVKVHTDQSSISASAIEINVAIFSRIISRSFGLICSISEERTRPM